MSASSRTDPRAVLAALVFVLAIGCTGEGSFAGPGAPGSRAAGPPTFADVDAAMEARVRDLHLDGAGVLVVRDGSERHRRFYGSFTGATEVPIASASKWLTSATVMALVDEGRLALDDPVSRYLPAWRADAAGEATASVTIRQLLSHQAGIAGSASCLGRAGSTLRACADEIAATPSSDAPGTAFHYGNAGYTVVAAVAEVAGGAAFEELFRDRIGRPVGMVHTSFTAPDAPSSTPPVPAASGVSTLDDLDRFVSTMAADGVTPDGTRVLRAASVREIERDQLHGLDTHDDAAVRITGFGTYGLGVWRDRSAADGTTQMVSGSGSVGVYPWIDRERDAYGVVLVDDEAGGGGRAVRASTRLVHDLILPALDAGG